MKYSDFLKTHAEALSKEDIRVLRMSTGLTQIGFEEKYGIPRRTMQAWETGVRKAPEYVLLLLAYAVLSDVNATTDPVCVDEIERENF